MLYSFADCTLNTERRELRRNGDLVAVTPQVFDLLEYLICNRERVIGKDDLIAAIWKGRIVSESAMTTRINGARYAIGDSGEEQRLIKTLARKGIRFVGIVQEERDAMITGFAEQPKQAPADPDRPSIAVLPFSNTSGDPEQEYFADGMVEEIITALSRTRWLFVIARNSTFVYKGRAVDMKQVRRELGVRYVLEGSIRKAGNRVRISCQLIDAVSDAVLWADHFDGSLNDVFDLQDKVAITVTGVIEPALVAAEIRRSIERQTTDIPVYDLYLRARADAMSWEKPRLLRAIDLLRHALEFDPYYGPALVLAAQCRQNLYQNDWSEDLEGERQQSIDQARRAIRASGDDPYVLGEAAFVIGYFEREIDPAIVLIDRSLVLNPSSALAWFRSGWLRLWAGQIDLGIEHFENSRRFNPLRPAPPSFGIAVGHFFARRLERAVVMLRLSLQENRRAIAFWLPVAHIWDTSTRRERSSSGSAISRLQRFRGQNTGVSQSNESSSWRVCA